MEEKLAVVTAALTSYQTLLGNLTLAVLTATGVLFFSNRKQKKLGAILPIALGGTFAALAAYLGLEFSGQVIDNALTVTVKDPYLNRIAQWQFFLLIASTICLIIGSANSESDA